MEEYFPAPERRYPSPSAQRRNGEHWKARFGLGFVILLTLVSAAIMFRIAGLGVGTATSALRVQGPGAPARPAAAATVPTSSGQQPGNQPAAAPTAPPAQAPAGAAQPTTPPTPTTSPNQRQYTVQSGDSLYSISQRFNTTVDTIVAANNLPSRNAILRVGQVLVIPG